MTSGEDARRFERQLADQFPEWACVASPAGSAGDEAGQAFGFICQRAMPAQPVGDDEEHHLTFTGSSWDEAFQRALEGLRPGDQGDPDDR